MTAGRLIAVVFSSAAGMSVKSVTGIGYPLFAIPLLIPTLGITDAVVVLSVPNAVANLLIIFQVHQARSQTRDLPVLLSAEVVGVIAGSIALVSWPEEPLLVALIIMIGLFVTTNLRSVDFAISPRAGRRWSLPVGLASGATQGAIGVSGPIVVAWMYSYRLPRDAFIYSITAAFLIGGVAQIAVLAGIGAYTPARLVAATLATIPVVVLAPIGERLRNRLSHMVFDRMVLAVLVISGLVLTWRVFT